MYGLRSLKFNGVARIFVWGGHSANATRYFLRRLRKPARFSGGGGVVAEIFLSPRERTRISGGGVVADSRHFS